MLAAEQLSFAFSEGPVLFEGVDWALEPNEIFCLLGPGGEGKSVFLKLLVSLLTPSEGRVTYGGRDIESFSREEKRAFHRDVGFAFQRNGLFDSLSCGDNLRFPLSELLKLKGEEREARVREALSDVGLAGQENLRPSEMSGGMQKRLGIARALSLSPKIILYDEPTSGLDPLTSVQIYDLILKARDKYGMSAVIATTDPVQAFRLADRVGFLFRGRLIEVGTPNRLKASENPVLRQFLSGSPDGPLTEGRL